MVVTVSLGREEPRPPPSPGSLEFSRVSGRLGSGIATVLCEGGSGAALGAETVADLPRIGTDDRWGEVVIETEGEEGRRSAEPGPIPELDTESTTTPAEGDRTEDIDAPES